MVLSFSLESGIWNCYSQNNTLVLNGTYLKLNGGTSTTPIYLVVGQNNASGITRISGHIISESDYNFIKWNMGSATGVYVYPFGYGITDYLPLTFNKTAGNSSLAVSTYYPTINPNANLPLANTVTSMNPSGPTSDAGNMLVDRWWRLQVENGVTAPVADLTFSYRGSENTITGINCPVDVITSQYWDANTSSWIAPAFSPGSGCGTSGVGTVLASGVSVFTTISSLPFVLVKSTSLLPVELVTFSAKCNNGQVAVKWTTASETNNDFFTVERSTDAIHFTSAGSIQGAGNSGTVHDYEFTDFFSNENDLGGVLYYRLTQTDYDGQLQAFSPVSVSPCSENSGFSVTVYPNPVSDGNINALVNGAANENILVTLKDVPGKNVFSKTIVDISGYYLLNINMKDRLTPGIYFVTASTNNEYTSVKIIINK